VKTVDQGHSYCDATVVVVKSAPRKRFKAVAAGGTSLYDSLLPPDLATMQPGAKLVATLDVGTVLHCKGAATAPGWIKVADAHGKKGSGGERWVQLTPPPQPPPVVALRCRN
jgi:hypothetical protein